MKTPDLRQSSRFVLRAFVHLDRLDGEIVKTAAAIVRLWTAIREFSWRPIGPPLVAAPLLGEGPQTVGKPCLRRRRSHSQ